MNQQALEGMASQKIAEMRASAAGGHPCQRARVWVPRQSFRARTGWTLVDLGLRLIAQPGQRSVTARPVGS